MADRFTNHQEGLESPAFDAAAITPNNDNDLAQLSRGVYVGTSGDLTIQTARGTAVTFVGLAAGVIHPIRCKRILATGTDAEDIVAVW